MRAWSGGAGLASSSAALGLSCPCRALSLCEVFLLPEADAAYSAFAFNASVVAVQVRFCRCDQPGALLRVFSCRRWFRPIVVSGRLLLVCSVFPPRPGRKHSALLHSCILLWRGGKNKRQCIDDRHFLRVHLPLSDYPSSVLEYAQTLSCREYTRCLWLLLPRGLNVRFAQ